MAVLSLSEIRNARRLTSPFVWAETATSYEREEIGRELSATFPRGDFKEFSRKTGKKAHLLYAYPLIDRKRGLLNDRMPSPLWRELCEELQSADYRAAIEAALEVDLADTLLEVSAWRQPRGAFIDPHPDNPEKRVSHLLFLNQEPWRPEYGGCLRLLRSSDIDDYAVELPPTLGRSVMFRRSDDSWHGYKPINCDHDRLSIQAVFSTHAMSYSVE